MSFGKMHTHIQILQKVITKDSEGFSIENEVVLASVRAYREGRQGTRKWANRAAFSEATDLFVFRQIPGLTITPALLIIEGEDRLEITSVEDVRGRGMYTGVLAKKLEPNGGS